MKVAVLGNFHKSDFVYVTVQLSDFKISGLRYAAIPKPSDLEDALKCDLIILSCHFFIDSKNQLAGIPPEIKKKMLVITQLNKCEGFQAKFPGFRFIPLNYLESICKKVLQK